MKTSEILNKSADAIREQGWASIRSSVQPWGGEGGICIEGGLLAAMGLQPTDNDQPGFLTCPAYRAVVDYLEPMYPHIRIGRGVRLYRFNDTDGRTAEEVIETLRACAVIEEAREEAEVKQEVMA